MPYILGGTASACVFLLVMISFTGDPDALVPFMISLVLLLTAMASYRSPAVALMPELTPAPVRSRANAIINFMGAVGGMTALIMIRVFVKTPAEGSLTDYRIMAVMLAILMIVCVGILFITVPEGKLLREEGQMDTEETAEEKKKGSKLPKEVRKSMRFLLAATAAAVLSYMPIGALSQKFGRKKMIILGIVMMTFCYTVGAFVRSCGTWINILFAVIGFGWAAIGVNSYPMAVEMADQGEIGRYTGFYCTSSMAAQVFTPIASGALLQYVSYQTLFPYAAVFSVLSLLAMLGVKHGEAEK